MLSTLIIAMSSINSTTTYSPEYLAETRVPQALVAVILCPVLALCSVILRLYTRGFLLKRVFWDDYVIIMAMITSIMMSVFMTIAFTNGSGRHIQAVTKDQLALQSRISPGVHINYNVTHMFLKLSILLHYTRICVMAFERRLCWGLITVLMSGSIALLIVGFVRCIPFQAIWTPGIPGARCINTAAVFLAGQIYTLIMDFIILIVPLVILRHLSIPWSQRVVLVMVLGLSSMACIVAIFRLQVLRLSATSRDRTWDSYYSAIYGVIEPNVGIICACIVTLRPLVHKIKCLNRGSSPGGSGTGGDSTSSRVVELPMEVWRPNPRRQGDSDILAISQDEVEMGEYDDDQFSKEGKEEKTKKKGHMGITNTITESDRELVSTHPDSNLPSLATITDNPHTRN